MTTLTNSNVSTLSDTQIEGIINNAVNNMDYQRRRMVGSWLKTVAANVVHLEQRIRAGHGDAIKRYRTVPHSILIDELHNIRIHPTTYNLALDQVKARHGWLDVSTVSVADPVDAKDFKAFNSN